MAAQKVLLKLMLRTKEQAALREILRELSWTLSPAGPSDLAEWLFVQARLHPKVRAMIRRGVRSQLEALQTTRYAPGDPADRPGRTTFLAAPEVAAWIQDLGAQVGKHPAPGHSLQETIRALFLWTTLDWDSIKTLTGWTPVYRGSAASLHAKLLGDNPENP